MDKVHIHTRPRFTAGSAIAKKVRRAGLLPAVMYGEGTDNRMLATDPKALTRALTGPYGRNQVLSFDIKGEEGEYLALARQIQWHSVTRKLLHVDLFVVKPHTELEVIVPVKLVGRSEGQKIGGRVQFISRQVRVSCTPDSMPTAIEVDLTPLPIGAAVTINDLPFPEGVKPSFRKAYKILEILPPKAAEEEVEAEATEEETAAAAAAQEEEQK